MKIIKRKFHYKLKFTLMVIVTIFSACNNVNYPNCDCYCNSCAIIKEGLIVCYPFTGNGKDRSGNGWDSDLNDFVLTTDRFGDSLSAVYYSGMSAITTNCPVVTGKAPRTVMFWFKTDTIGIITALRWGGPHENYYNSFRCWFNTQFNDSMGVTIDIGHAQIVYKATINDNKWHHYTWVLPELEKPRIIDVNIYQDAVLLTNAIYHHDSLGRSLSAYINTISDDIKLSIGLDEFSGYIDDVLIYNRALSEKEIKLIFNSSKP